MDPQNNAVHECKLIPFLEPVRICKDTAAEVHKRVEHQGMSYANIQQNIDSMAAGERAKLFINKIVTVGYFRQETETSIIHWEAKAGFYGGRWYLVGLENNERIKEASLSTSVKDILEQPDRHSKING